MARDDLPTPFWPSRAILRGPSGRTSRAGASSKAGLKLMGEADGPAAPDVQSQSSWTASSLLSWCLMGRGVLPLRTAEALGRVRRRSYCRRNANSHFLESKRCVWEQEQFWCRVGHVLLGHFHVQPPEASSNPPFTHPHESHSLLLPTAHLLVTSASLLTLLLSILDRYIRINWNTAAYH